jgi:RNA polymerase sigma-70 factor (ECF subfamily)
MGNSQLVLDESSIAELLQKTAPMLRNYLESRIPARLHSLIATDDLLQEIWIGAFQALPGITLNGENALNHWLITLARRKLINAIKRVHRLKRGGDRVAVRLNSRTSTVVRDLLASIPAANRTPSSLVGVSETADAVKAAMSDLPVASRQAIWLRFIAGHPLHEVADMMQRTTSSVRALIFRGLRQMKGRLGSAGKFITDAPISES